MIYVAQTLDNQGIHGGSLLMSDMGNVSVRFNALVRYAIDEITREVKENSRVYLSAMAAHQAKPKTSDGPKPKTLEKPIVETTGEPKLEMIIPEIIFLHKNGERTAYPLL